MCSDNVFTIIVWEFIKIAWKLQKLELFPPIYPHEKSVKFQSCDFCKAGVLTPTDSIPRL